MHPHITRIRRRQKEYRETKKEVDGRYQRVDFTFGCRMHDTGQRSRGLEETGAPTFHGPQPSAMRKRTNERTNDIQSSQEICQS